MLRGGPQASAPDFSKQQQQQQQKQKKRLSFRDPEIEGPQKGSFLTGCRSKTLSRPTKVTNTRKFSSSVEDLTLEDQALQIVQNVGSAFSDLSVTDSEQVDILNSIPSDVEKETEIRDSSPTDLATYQRSCQLRSFKISAEDQQYLDDIVPPLQYRTMRGPSVENSDANSTKNCIPNESPHYEARPPSSSQHQIQLLRYHLDQQNQQTQMALYQVQLLQDQMDAENAARRKAQEQNNHLMQQNKELLNHMEQLFQEIEDLEKQIELYEQEKRYKRPISHQEQQIAPHRQPMSYVGSRRSSTEQVTPEKPALQNRTSYANARKSSLTSLKPLATNAKALSNQAPTPTSATRKPSIISQRPYVVQTKNPDFGTKTKDTLRIGDASPPVQSGTLSPFSSAWKSKSPEGNTQVSVDKVAGNTTRSRAGSFSSFVKKPQEGSTVKSTLFSSGNNLSSTVITNKKYSSSTSDLYNSPSSLQGKSTLAIDEPSTSVKSAVSNASLSTVSKLPRYQPYTGWQRRTSLTNDSEPISSISKDAYKNTSLFNR